MNWRIMRPLEIRRADEENTWRVRGITLGLIGCDELTIKNLEQQCRRLGMKTQIFTNFIDPAQFYEADALIFDSDNPRFAPSLANYPGPNCRKSRCSAMKRRRDCSG